MYIYKHGNYMLSIDWLQAYCIGGVVVAGVYTSSIGNLTVELQEGGTANFSRRSLIYWNGVEVATLLQCPKMSALDRLLTELKLHNRVLYTSQPVRIMKAIIEAIHITYKGIARIDLACDCNTLAGGRSVESLIANFVHLMPREVGHVIRKGSARYTLHGNNHRKANIRHESIKFGSPQADVVPYIYNKSLELLEVHDKPWIRQAWKEAGLVHLVDIEGLQQLSKKELEMRLNDSGVSEYIRSGVWRFEISIKAHGKDLLNLESGEIFKMGLDEVSTAEKIEEIFVSYCKKFFAFRECTSGERVRDYKDITLFEFDKKMSYRQISIPTTGETGRFDASVANYLTRIVRTYSDLASPVAAGVCEARDLISAIAGAKMYKLKEQRFNDFLNELYCTNYYEALMKEAINIPFSMAENLNDYREWLNHNHSEHSK